jgi:hypothetical protein
MQINGFLYLYRILYSRKIRNTVFNDNDQVYVNDSVRRVRDKGAGFREKLLSFSIYESVP